MAEAWKERIPLGLETDDPYPPETPASQTLASSHGRRSHNHSRHRHRFANPRGDDQSCACACGLTFAEFEQAERASIERGRSQAAQASHVQQAEAELTRGQPR